MSTTTPHTQTAYKDTPIGKIPADWEVKRLGDVCEKITDGTHDTPEPTNEGVPFLTAIHIKEGFIDFASCYFLPNEIHQKIYKRCNPELGDVLLVNIGAGVGTSAVVNVDYQFSLKNVALLKPLKRQLIGEFLNYYQIYSKGRLVKNLLNGGAQPFLSLKNISNLKIPLPPLSEQKRIAEVLSTWDKAIQLTEQLIRQKELRKKWLMQNLLTGKMRLKGFSGVWKFVKFKDFYSESKLKVGSKKYEVLSVTKTGIVPQSEYFNKEIASSNTSNYLIVEKGDFVVSGLNFWMGSFDVLSNFDIGIVSPAYKVYKLKVGFEKTFFKFLSKSKLMLDAMIGASIVGASIVRRNFDKEILMEWSFKIPSIEEQTAIAEVLQTADKEIELLKAKAEQLKEQKKGLMQQLLTGRMRLNLITINK